MSEDLARAFAREAPRKGPALRLICFPYAGGGAAAFRAFRAFLPGDVELCPVQLPGRELRLKERPLTDLTAAIELFCAETAPLRAGPYAFFGHSLGGLLAFELTRALRRRGDALPRALFVSACRAPQADEKETSLSELDDAAFVAALRAFDGTPSRVLEDPELVSLLLPTLRADFALRDSYAYQEEPPLPLPITAYGGEQDEHVSLASLFAWRAHTQRSFSLSRFQGGHFYFRDDPAFARTFAASLSSLTRRGRGQSEEARDATRI